MEGKEVKDHIHSEAELEETIYALGYELIEKQKKGNYLTVTEMSFVTYIYKIVDEQIQRLLRKITV